MYVGIENSKLNQQVIGLTRDIVDIFFGNLPL